ncbi:hypothetical protein GCM10009122_06990 [Fulvivirga kasyanovii]
MAYHLSGLNVAIEIVSDLPVTLISEESQTSSLTAAYQVSSQRDLFDLSTRKVYRAPLVTLGAVSSYLTFSPFPPIAQR